MNIYNWSSLAEHYKVHPDCKKTLEKWYHDVLTKEWTKPNDITKDFSKARTIKNDRAIFEVNGSDYRLIVKLNYEKGWVFIKFIGTHAEYDKIDPETIDMYKRK
ncbi:MAG: type II toxin-antitoxin system HigB family toxin [Bacteroidetes bacterium]|nr:type II toxin-antitoxin system HigB family toxin [Bacteroidota bacterium]